MGSFDSLCQAGNVCVCVSGCVCVAHMRVCVLVSGKQIAFDSTGAFGHKSIQ